MSITYIPVELRRCVRERAGECCEYCRIREAITLLGCEVDHIISEKHGSLTVEFNLALDCFACNRAKGLEARLLTRFFPPKWDAWDEHFSYDPSSDEIRYLTSEGRVTMRLFGFNTDVRLAERLALAQRGLYP